jgi:hypothetical protein
MNNTQLKGQAHSWLSEFGPICCGHITRVDRDGRPIVDFMGNPAGPAIARCLEGIVLKGPLDSQDISVLLAFEHGDPTRPVILGVVASSILSSRESGRASMATEEPSQRYAITDGRRVVIEGSEEVTLVCGKSSITLTKDGRISLRGVEILSRASRANKIRGASVSIN